MSSWNRDDWEAMCSGDACPICKRGQPLGIIAELDATYLTSSPDSPMKGYGCLVLKRHVVEVYELEDEEAGAFIKDLQHAARAIQVVT